MRKTIILAIATTFLAGASVATGLTRIPGTVRVPRRFTVAWTVRPDSTRGTRARTKGSTVMIRTAIISMTASFVLFGVWTVNLISYHPATDLNPLAPLNTNIDWR